MPCDPRGRHLPGSLSILLAVFVLLVVAATPLIEGAHGDLLRPVGNEGSSGAAAAADMELASTRVYYVSPRGRDTNSGTRARPWKSIYKAMTKMTHGGTLYVRGGTYAYSGENIIGIRRTAATRVHVRNYPGERPIFRTTSTQAIFMWFRNAAYITVEGLTVYGDLHAPTRVSHGGAIFQFTGNTSSIIIRSNAAYGGPLWADTQHGVYIGAGTVRGISITSNLFDGRGGDGAGFHAYHDPNGKNVLVRSNVFRNWDQCILVWSNIRSLTITRNTVQGCRIGIRYHESSGTLVTLNKSVRNSQAIQRDTRVNLREVSNSWN